LKCGIRYVPWYRRYNVESDGLEVLVRI